MDSSAFVQPSFSSSFAPARTARAAVSRRPAPATPARFVMEEKKPMFRNPFAAKEKDPNASTTAYMAPQPGDPGYKEKTAPKPQKLPVVSGTEGGAKKRGLDLLKDDILKNAPERAGVGRQDAQSVVMRPQAGEPGYKPAAYQTVKVSSLGISTFSDDKNYVSKVGGIEAVKKAALDVKTGNKTAKEIKKEVLSGGSKPTTTSSTTPSSTSNPSAKTVASKAPTRKPSEPVVYDIPDYLKPLPEDTPRKGMSWKNY